MASTLTLQPGSRHPGGTRALLPHQASALLLRARLKNLTGARPFGQLLEGESDGPRTTNADFDRQVLDNAWRLLRTEDLRQRDGGLRLLAKHKPEGAIELITRYLESETNGSLRIGAIDLFKTLPGGPAVLARALNSLMSQHITASGQSASNTGGTFPDTNLAMLIVSRRLLDSINNLNWREFNTEWIFISDTFTSTIRAGGSQEMLGTLAQLAGKTTNPDLIDPLYKLRKITEDDLAKQGYTVLHEPDGAVLLRNRTWIFEVSGILEAQLKLIRHIDDSIGKLAAHTIVDDGTKLHFNEGSSRNGLVLPGHTSSRVESDTELGVGTNDA